MFLRIGSILKICSVLAALTFWIILLKGGKLNVSGLVSIILLVFLANDSIFLVRIVNKRENLDCVFAWIGVIWSRYSKEGCKIKLKSAEICEGVIFLYWIRIRKFSILFWIWLRVGADEPSLS